MCVLRAFGQQFQPTTFLQGSSLGAYSVFNRGARRFRTGDALEETSGLKVDVSAADWNDLAQQFADALQFLKTNRAELARLAAWPGVEAIVLDFPTDATGSATFVQIPISVAREATDLGIALEVSVYSGSDAPLQDAD